MYYKRVLLEKDMFLFPVYGHKCTTPPCPYDHFYVLLAKNGIMCTTYGQNLKKEQNVYFQRVTVFINFKEGNFVCFL